MTIDQNEIEKMSKEELLEWILVLMDELKQKYNQIKDANELLK